MTRFACTDVDAAKLELLWREQQGMCAVTGLQMVFPGPKRHPRMACMTWVPCYTAPVDTVKPMLCTYFINVLLRSFPLHQVEDVVRLASENARVLLKAQAPAQACVTTQTCQASSISPDVSRQLARALTNSLRRAVSRKKLQSIPDRHTLTLQSVKDMWVRQGGRCAISGVPMTARRGSGMSADMLTLDRVDSSLGYTPQNTQLCTHACNLCKSDMLQQDFLQMLSEIHL